MTVVLFAVVLVALAACSGVSEPATAAPSPEDGQAAAPEPSGETPASEGGEVEPAEPEPSQAEGEDGEWLVDEEGRRYREHRMPKIENFYEISSDGEYVYLPPGLRYDLVRVEDDAFVVKHYDPTQAEARRRKALGQDTEGGEAEAGAAEEGPLEAEVTEVDRVELTRFDQGLPNRGQWRQGFAVADLDGDGHLDIAHGPVRKGGTAPVVFLGDSQGNWRPWRELRYQGPPLDYGDTAAADFDGDGHVDLAFAVHLRGILIALGDGEGGFKAWQTEGLEYRIPGEGQQPPPYTSRTVSVVDWNRDGRPDLLTLSEGPQMTRNRNLPRMEEGVWGAGLYLNRGDGHWAAQSGQTLPTLPFGDDLTVGDFDGDGLLDFATAMHVAGSKAILHLGEEEGGGFTQRVFEPLPLGLATAVEAADFDGDGRDDLAVGMTAANPGAEEAQNVVLVFLAREEGRWERRVLAAEADRLGVWSLGAGDLDGDGHTDLVALTGVGDRWLFLGTGDGGFQREDSPELASEAPGCRGYEVVLRDLNGDGRDEAILAFAGEEGLSDQLRPGERARQCPSGGSLEVWTLAESGAGE